LNYKKTYGEILKEIDSNANGLTDNEAKERLKKYGYNELKSKEKDPLWELFLASFKDPLVVVLLVASIVQVFLGKIVESAIIFSVLVLNSVLGVSQTRKAESSLESLKQMSAPNAKVIRDGKKITIPATEITVGDIV
jgi:P-type Ca2+ transporter type 2C